MYSAVQLDECRAWKIDLSSIVFALVLHCFGFGCTLKLVAISCARSVALTGLMPPLSFFVDRGLTHPGY